MTCGSASPDQAAELLGVFGDAVVAPHDAGVGRAGENAWCEASDLSVGTAELLGSALVFVARSRGGVVGLRRACLRACHLGVEVLDRPLEMLQLAGGPERLTGPQGIAARTASGQAFVRGCRLGVSHGFLGSRLVERLLGVVAALLRGSLARQCLDR